MRANIGSIRRTPSKSRRFANRTAFVFDLDGTLIDSAPDIAEAANRLLEEYGGRPQPIGKVMKMVGGGAPKLLQRAFAAAGLAMPPAEEALARFLEYYHTGPTMMTKPYPGVPQLLAAMHRAGNPIALCTNKPGRATAAILARLGWDGLFDAVVSGDDLSVKKPDPLPVQAALFLAGGTPNRAVYVGDSHVDVQAARNAGLPVMVLTHGYAHGPVSALRADALATTVRPLLRLAGS